MDVSSSVTRNTRILLSGDDERFIAEGRSGGRRLRILVGAVEVTTTPPIIRSDQWLIHATGRVIKADGTAGLRRGTVRMDWGDLPAPIRSAIRTSLSHQTMPLAPGSWFS